MTGHHKLVPADIVDTSTARQSRDGSVSDFGWDKGAQYDVRPWIKGLDNEATWVLVRRMNHGIFDLRRTRHVPPGGLDLIQAKDAKFSPNKFRSEVERLYMGMMLGLFSFMKSMARLRSWREPRRTSAFCIAYFAAWYLDCLIALFLCTNIALVISPQVRLALFPPAPLSMVNISDGSIAKPMGGTLGSTDTATGAPQNLKGESAENEASNFITSVAAIATNLLSGQDPYGAPTEMDAGNEGNFTPQLDVSTMAVAKDKASGMDRPSEDKTKAPIEETVWKQMTPLLHGIILLADTWERLSNILLPTPPFDRENHQFRLALYIAPLAVASLILTRDVAVKSFTFLLGFALFGDPLLTWGYHYARRNGWTESFHPSNTLFRGAPTNLQIALTLLRLGEANQAPLPPPAMVHHAPPDKAIYIDENVIDASLGDQPLGVSQHHLEDTAEHNPDMADHAGGDDSEVIQATGHGAKREKVFGLFKDGARGAVKAIAAADKLRAKVGVENSKLRAGVVPSSRDATEIVGPVQFSARYEGQTGFIHINSGAEEPWVAFNRNAVDEHGDLRTVWKIKIDDIVQLRKHTGHGMLAKLATGWATDGPIYDSVRIIDTEENEWVVTALPYRDALFNRLCAIGKRAKWEIW